MAGDTLGVLFRITNWGESHGLGIGVIIEGCPPAISISPKDIQVELDRRRPGQSQLTTARNESDQIQILSGVYNGKTTGTPINLSIINQDQRSKDYNKLASLFRPSHADFTYTTKYGFRDPSGGGRSSARTTAGTVAAGAVARKILTTWFNLEIVAFVKSIKDIRVALLPKKIIRDSVDQNIVRCPDQLAAEKMINLIEDTKKKGDSVGGMIECHTYNMPAGLGEPVYDKLEADLGKAVLSINACKGFEIGSGFDGTALYGSQHNDEFMLENGKVVTKTNNSGGVQGGISNGMPIVFRAAFKPTATILQNQKTVNDKLEVQNFTATGRHDPCVLIRAVPIVEAMTAIIILDHALRHRGQVGHLKPN